MYDKSVYYHNTLSILTAIFQVDLG